MLSVGETTLPASRHDFETRRTIRYLNLSRVKLREELVNYSHAQNGAPARSCSLGRSLQSYPGPSQNRIQQMLSVAQAQGSPSNPATKLRRATSFSRRA